MKETHISKIAEELNLDRAQVAATGALLEDGSTVPFIARYRKEATGSLDEVAITAIRDRVEQLEELDKRREAILASLIERDLLTDELRDAVLHAETMAKLEDIYLPYRPKRRTRATIAKEKGLEPLADIIFAQNTSEPIDPEAEAAKFIDEEKGVASVEEALFGARDIIAESINEDQEARAAMRDLFFNKAILSSKLVKNKEEEGAKYRDYFDWNEPITKAPSHRILAILRGERESFLTVKITPPEEEAIAILESEFVKGDVPASKQVSMAVHDGYKRLLAPSMETELRNEAKKRADTEAIRVFMENLRELLLAPPLGQKNVLAIDPGYRTGCKVVCLNRQGKLLHDDIIYITHSKKQLEESLNKVKTLCEKFSIEAVAIGNGTASRETETFIRGAGLPSSIQVVVVNESGASIYSASEVARKEFPEKDVTVRGSVSIGRRLMDPLAELVKIDPKSIGVGQYQHDVDQTSLKRSLDDVVVSCVNAVGVEVNTASGQLLSYVSGLGPQLAGNIVQRRDEKGPFKSREELREVPRLGPKAFEQAAGFLRIHGAENPLDSSAVHPESYAIVEKMAADLGVGISDLMSNDDLRKKIRLEDYITEKAGLPTLTDILQELAKPGRDPREKFEEFRFADGIDSIEALKPGMKLPGIVTNVTAFGAFVDVGVHQDGLVHISQLSDKFVKNPAEIVKVSQKVNVTVVDVDIPRKRIALSMRSEPFQERPPKSEPRKKPERRQQRPPQQSKPQPKPVGSDWFSEALRKAKDEKKRR